MMKAIVYFLFFLLSISACENIIIDNDKQQEDNIINNVKIMMSEAVCEGMYGSEETRVIVTFPGAYNSGGYQNYIFNGDTIGIFPSTGDQIPFVIQGLVSPAPSFDFEARGWGLKSDITYYAYTPFSRKNYADSININHVNVTYIGQVIDSVTAATNNALDLNFNNQSNYSYLYSTPTDADASGDLNFSMQYLGGGVRFRCIFRSLPPDRTSYEGIKIFHSKLVTNDPVLLAEGTFNLKQTAKDCELALLTSSAFTPTITPTSRGMVNVIPAKVDTFELFKILGTYYGMYYLLHLPPLPNLSGQNLKLILYDTDMNWYYADLNVAQIKVKTFTAGIAYMYYGGKAVPENIYIAPWDSITENVNQNWNYK